MVLLYASILTADAFCGTYVGGADSELYNEYSQLAVVREGNSTTLTIVNDVQGNFDSFALVIPVPEVIPEDKVKVLEPELFDRLDAYSQPRLVEYDCSNVNACFDCAMMESASAFGNRNSEPAEEPEISGVDVEASYTIGEYEVVILSSEESSALFTWLNYHGYQVPGQSVELLQEYIDSDAKFLAAKIDANADVPSGAKLSPLQFSYESEVFQIPIRIGTLNSKEAQDLVIYSVSSYEEGSIGISNYPEFQIEDECMWDSQGESFGEYFSTQFDNGYDEVDNAAWTVEYAWGGGGCDPCSGDPPDGDDLVKLGVNSEYIHTSDYFFTRLHARYTPAQATQELMLYQTGMYTNDQYRFIKYKPELEEHFPICGVGWIEDPDVICVYPENRPICGSSDCAGSTPLLLGLFGLGFWRRRKNK